MNIYKGMYLYLFNRVTDALIAIDRGNTSEAEEMLKAAQRACEEMFMRGCDLRRE